MSREAVYHAVILKKQAYGDADEIVTFYTLEAGRVRGLAKSVKLPQSKLQNALQGLFYVRVVLAQGSRYTAGALRKIIRCEVLDTFMPLRASLESTKAGMFASEAVYKSTADEHKNPGLFKLVLEFLQNLSRLPEKNTSLPGLLAKFQISLLEALGFAISASHEPVDGSGQLYFTSMGGGFSFKEDEPDRVKIDAGLRKVFLVLKKAGFQEAAKFEPGLVTSLNQLLGGFLEYQLERKIHSRRLFTG
jgi:DNA repair protein RecO